MRTSFHAHVIAARLGAEGIVTDLRGNIDGLYPMGDVHVFVAEDELAEAKELLMVDDVESAFDSPDDAPEGLAPRELWIIVGAVLAIAAVIFARTF